MSRTHRARAATPSSSAAYPPLSLQELVRSAEMFEWRPQIPLKFHIGSLDAMYREGLTYYEEHNYAKAYVLLLRYSIICMDRVPTHPEASTSDGRKLIKIATRRLKNTVFPLLESIKNDLVEARQRWIDHHGAAATATATAATAATTGSTATKKMSSTTMGSDEADAVFAARDPALSWNPHSQAELLDASEHVNLAVQLANKRRIGASDGGAGVGSRAPVSRRPVPSRQNTDTNAGTDDTSREMERARWQLEEMSHQPNYDNYDDGRPKPMPVSYNYPSVHRSTPVDYESMRFDEKRRASEAANAASRAPLPPPRRPTFEIAPPVPLRGEHRPSRFNDDLASLSRTGELPLDTTSVAQPPRLPPKEREAEVIPTAPKKSQYTFKPAAYLENGAPIRSVFLPDTLRHDFLRIAQPNTSRGIETCGILCGKTANNALFITCLLIPQQTGTKDSCETTGEVETFEFCSAEDLIQIGWIHTHPTQTCFMSSLDMHTHAGYQMMMDESIAIVCAPKFEPNWGIFRLTNPPGLPYIGGCRKEGAFHEHSLRPHEIYTDAKNPPGHVFVVAGIDYTVKDLRKG